MHESAGPALPLRAVVDQLAVGIMVAHGEAGALTYSNPAAQQQIGWELPLGMTLAQFSDLPLFTVDGARLRGEELPLAQALRSGRVVRGELVVERADGRRRVLRMAATPLDGDTAAAVAVFEDITAQRESEQLRERFVHALGHELRNPLSVIKTALAVLRKRTQDFATLDRIERSIARMNRMIGDVMDMGRVQSRHGLSIEPEVCDLGEIVAEAVAATAPPECGVTVELEREGDLSAEIDHDRILQVAVNLLSNAVKYSRPGGRVEVRVSEHETDRLHLEVRDHGIGIPRDEQRRLFEPFFRGRNAERAASGLGLGLFLSAQIARAHGGEIAGESTPGKGSTFHLWLPRRRPARPPEEDESLLRAPEALSPEAMVP